MSPFSFVRSAALPQLDFLHGPRSGPARLPARRQDGRAHFRPDGRPHRRSQGSRMGDVLSVLSLSVLYRLSKILLFRCNGDLRFLYCLVCPKSSFVVITETCVLYSLVCSSSVLVCPKSCFFVVTETCFLYTVLYVRLVLVCPKSSFFVIKDLRGITGDVLQTRLLPAGRDPVLRRRRELPEQPPSVSRRRT
jgi:hypothetical protein